MFFYLSRIMKSGSPTDPGVRRRIGMFSGLAGIILNFLLFAVKFTAGLLSGALSVTADSFNNLADAGSSVITLVGFNLAGKKPDKKHPFGYGRIEYITGFVVSIALILMGFELAMSSLDSIGNPSLPEYSSFILIVLIVSVAVKFYMAAFNYKLSATIDSFALKAAAKDSLMDSVSTSAVLACLLLSQYTQLRLDAWMSLAVSLLILWSGINSAKETIAPLLGTKPDPELVKSIEDMVLSYSPEIVGMHDLVVHDYGPGRLIISLHAEIPGDINVFTAHSIIDDLETDLGIKFSCEAVVHFDPIDTKDETLLVLRDFVLDIMEQISPELSAHDFRFVPGDSHTNLLFDLVVPFNFHITNKDLKAMISSKVKEAYNDHYCIIKIDRPRA